MHLKLIKKGAEADLFSTKWQEKEAVIKIRKAKRYRHKQLDDVIRERRTVHEANMINAAKATGIRTPFVYFLDAKRYEIIMEFVDGKNVKEMISKNIGLEVGKYVSLLHNHNIIHGDLTTSNFIQSKDNLFLIDFGLSFYSERIEDRAMDIRVMKEILQSAHVDIFEETFENFLVGYSRFTNNKLDRVLNVVKQIEKRGRYTRMS